MKASKSARGAEKPGAPAPRWPGGSTSSGSGRALVIAALILSATGVLGWIWVRGGGASFLPPRAPADWIIYPTPANGEALAVVELETEFRRGFLVTEAPPTARLLVYGFKRFVVRLNGEELSPLVERGANWKRISTYEVGTRLRPGTNELAVRVACSNGLPALWLCLDAGKLKITSDESWLASLAGGSWQPARRAAVPLPIRPGNRLYSSEQPWTALQTRWWVFVLLAAVAAGAVAIAGKIPTHLNRTGLWKRLLRSPQVALLCLLMLAWGALWANNLGRLPREIGFDAAEHLAYVQYILDKGSLPLANEGWEMYQPPLYYMIGAGLLKSLHLASNSSEGVVVLRLFGLVCGVSSFVLVFLSIRKLFPTAQETHVLGLLFAALLPVNLYLCQYVTNEVLAAALVAGSFYMCLRIISVTGAGVRQYALLGMLLGTALLTKSSALLVVPIIVVTLGWHLWQSGQRRLLSWGVRLGTMAAVCLLVCGWHYWRVAAHFGTPFLGNWDPRSGFVWWQQPGYRTATAFLEFGRCLAHPFYSAFAGIPDGLYSTLWGDGLYGGGADFRVRPPWNYDLMAAGYLFALAPMLAILAGGAIMLIDFCRKPRAASFLVLGTALLASMLLVYYALKVPSYAAAKTFYVLPALMPLCVFGATGLGALIRVARKWSWLIYVGVALWGLNAYASVWIRRQGPETRILMARTYATQGQMEAAVAEVKGLLRDDPRNAEAVQLLAVEAAQRGRLNEAADLAAEAVRYQPEDAEAHLVWATILYQQNKVDQAIAEARRTLELAPDHPKAASSLFAWLYRSGRKLEAAAACAESLRVNPFNAQFHYEMAVVARDLGDRTNALLHARLAEELKRGALKH